MIGSMGKIFCKDSIMQYTSDIPIYHLQLGYAVLWGMRLITFAKIRHTWMSHNKIAALGYAYRSAWTPILFISQWESVSDVWMMEPDVLAQGDYYIEVSVKITFFLFNIITCHKHLVVILYQNTSPLKMVVGPQSNNHMLKRFTLQFQSHDHKQCCWLYYGRNNLWGEDLNKTMHIWFTVLCPGTLKGAWEREVILHYSFPHPWQFDFPVTIHTDSRTAADSSFKGWVMKHYPAWIHSTSKSRKCCDENPLTEVT